MHVYSKQGKLKNKLIDAPEKNKAAQCHRKTFNERDDFNLNKMIREGLAE